MDAVASEHSTPAHARGWQRFTASRGKARIVALIVAMWAVLYAAVGVAMRVPASEVVPGFVAPGSLDPSSLPGSLAPLSEAFIRRVLGEGGPGLTSSPSRSIGSAVAPGPLIGGPVDRRVITHDLTNDDAEDAVAISAIPFTARSSNARASRSGDPADCSASGGTVWYRYRAPTDVGLVAYTFGSDHAVALGVFEQAGQGWRSLGCERNDAGNALITFQGVAGSTYFFQVTALARGGNLRFSLDPRGTMTVLTRATDGEPANSHTWAAPPSKDWRHYAFLSDSTNLTFQPPCKSNPPYSYNEGDLAPVYTYPCFQVMVLDRRTGKTTIVSSAADGTPGNHDSALHVALSGNGRYVAFASNATNLGPDDPPGQDLFVKDLHTGLVELIASAPISSVRSHLEQNTGVGSGVMDQNWSPAISHDGRTIAFQTAVSFDHTDTDTDWDVYTFDRRTRRYELISVPEAGTFREPNIPRDAWFSMSSGWAAVDLSISMSPDGRFIVFRTPASDLVTGDTNHTWDTFLRDRWTGVTERISVSSDEEQGNGPSVGQLFLLDQVSADGRFVVFDSIATNFMPAGVDDPATSDVFVRDRALGTTTPIGIQRDRSANGNLIPHYPSISPNGRFIGYTNWGESERYEECNGANTPIERTAQGLGVALGDLWECNAHSFVYDQLTDTTFPVTVLPTGEEWWGAGAIVDDDGARVMFLSYAKNSAGERVPAFQIYLYEATRPR